MTGLTISTGKRCCRYVIFALFLAHITVFSAKVPENQAGRIFENFKDPPREYSIMPLWSWNGTLEPNELKRQIDLMMDKGVYGAFMHARSGINTSRTPYFSPGWWEAVETAVEYSKKRGFSVCLYDEDKWPSGSAGGRTLKRNPKGFIKKGLNYETFLITGPADYNVPSSDALKVFAVRLGGDNRFETLFQKDITGYKDRAWQVPEGQWAILTFNVIEDRDRQIDYLDSEAVTTFINITHEEYYRRFGKYFGNTIPGVFFDEIFFAPTGRNVLPWTDDLADTFQERKGYSLLDNLPSLIFESERSECVNYDFLNEITERYYNAWFEQYASWCEEHNIWITGHTEEHPDAYKRQGDYIKTIGRLHRPLTDNEEFRYGFPRYIGSFKLKQVSSAAHFHGRKRVGVEAMGGGGYIITPEEYRYGFARFGVCGLNFFIPHLFHYSQDSPEAVEDWPPSWFFRNPYWKYFKPLADYGRRVSYMTSQGHHICHVALLSPLTDQWISGYNQESDSRCFIEAQNILLNSLIDYDIINPASLAEADCSEGKIKLNHVVCRVLVLPSLGKITLETAEKIKEFVENGGVLIALEKVPDILNCEDKESSDNMSELFGIDRRYAGKEYYRVDRTSYLPYTCERNDKGGRAYFSHLKVNLPSIIKKHIPDELRVISGDKSILGFHQRRTGKVTFYLLMNESRTQIHQHLSLPDYGTPYKFNNETGVITRLNYLTKNYRLEFVIDFRPWEAFYIVFVPGDKPRTEYLLGESTLKQAELVSQGQGLAVCGYAGYEPNQMVTILKSGGDKTVERWHNTNKPYATELDGLWNFMPAGNKIDYEWTDVIEKCTLAVPVMKFYAVFNGPDDGFKLPEYDDSQWATVKLTDSFSRLEGGERYLSRWNACQIVSFGTSHHFPGLGGEDAVFKKTISIKGDVKSAVLKLAARPSFRLFVNNQYAGKSLQPSDARRFDIAPFLKPGENRLKVEVPQNRGLLAEGYIRTAEQLYPILSNKTWTVELERGTERAFEVCKPPLGSLGQTAPAGEQINYPVTGWYRQNLPAGTQKIIIPKSSGRLEFYINGRQVSPVNGTIDLSEPEQQNGSVLAVRCVFSKLSDGLQGPLRVVCRPEPVRLDGWADYNLSWYTGRGIYTKEVNLGEDYIRADTKVVLDLGEVKWFAELWVNNRLVKYFPWGEFSADVTDYVKPGVNKISVIVSNLRANEAYRDIPDKMVENPRARWWHQGATDREKERLESGLLGPVSITAYQRVEKKLAVK